MPHCIGCCTCIPYGRLETLTGTNVVLKEHATSNASQDSGRRLPWWTHDPILRPHTRTACMQHHHLLCLLPQPIQSLDRHSRKQHKYLLPSPKLSWHSCMYIKQCMLLLTVPLNHSGAVPAAAERCYHCNQPNPTTANPATATHETCTTACSGKGCIAVP
jgi:hypothetical protein